MPGHRLRASAIILAAWTAVALLVATQVHVRSLSTDAPYRWLPLLLFELCYWYAWAALTPLIIRAAELLPLERGRRVVNLTLHAILSVALGLAMTAYFAWLVRLFVEPGQPDHGRTLGQTYMKYFSIGFHFDILLYWAVLGVGMAVTYQALFRERSERAARLQIEASELQARLARAQLDALRVQIQPHFLFNTLHAVSSLMDEDVRMARRMLSRLSDLLRLTLEKRDRQEVSLQEELEMVDCYLEIEKTRFEDRLSVQREIDPESLQAEVPMLILQPIVENAIRHGIARRSEPGRISIRSSVENGKLRLEVTDNGPGIPQKHLAALEFGLGLSNVRSRLERTYGSSSRLELGGAPKRGLRVALIFPYRPTKVGDAMEARRS
jgi:signal transduction histidine kinase